MLELKRLKLRSKIYTPFIIIGIVGITFAMIMGLGKEDPLVFDTHVFMLIGGSHVHYLE